MAVRLIIHTDSIKQSDVNTFKSAANTLLGEYRSRFPADRVERLFVRSGREIVAGINGLKGGVLASLDVVSHGNQGGVHIARRLNVPVKSSFLQEQAHYGIRRYSDRPQTRKDAEYCEESIHGLYTDWAARKLVAYYYNQAGGDGTDVAYLHEIAYDRFQPGAHVELHGCLTAEMLPFVNTYLKDNFAKQLSDNLPKGCTVVGHTDRSNPNLVPSSRISDYRHGPVRVYRDGAIVQESIQREELRFPNSSTP